MKINFRTSQQLLTSLRPLSNAAPVAIESIIHENVSDHQINYLKESCIAVDENDKVLGSISKALSHQKDTCKS